MWVGEDTLGHVVVWSLSLPSGWADTDIFVQIIQKINKFRFAFGLMLGSLFMFLTFLKEKVVYSEGFPR